MAVIFGLFLTLTCAAPISMSAAASTKSWAGLTDVPASPASLKPRADKIDQVLGTVGAGT